MTTAASRPSFSPVGACVLGLAAALSTGGGVAQAQTASSPTTVSAVPEVQRGMTGRQLWRLSDFTTVELVAREPGSAPNQHPWETDASTLRTMLQQVTITKGKAVKPLFGGEELGNLVPAIVEAFGNARPEQDVAVISSARHDDNNLYGVSAVTARLFFVDGHLNLIVHDPRYDFYDSARGMGIAPHFTIGSRTDPGVAPIHSPNAASPRPDWLVLNATPQPTAAEAAAPAPVAPPAPPVAPPAVVAAPAPVAPPAAVAPPAPGAAPAVVAPVQAAPAAPAAAPDAEQRLTTLKRLYDKGLITKSEYEKKRQEILKSL
jgi:hypothetical protein